MHSSSIPLRAASEPSPVTVFGPASLSNLGPGFDVLGVSIRGWGDRVEAWRSDEPGVKLVEGRGEVDWSPPLESDRNTAAVAAREVLLMQKAQGGLVLRISKGLPPGSGLGSSAASAVAGAWAANEALGCPLTKEALIPAALAGEAIASGTPHGDNVLPALLGGLILGMPGGEGRYRRLALPCDLPLSVVLPGVQVLTRQARAMLPAHVTLQDTVRQAARLAFLVDALRSGDLEAAGRYMMADTIVEPLRAGLLPCFEAVRNAALEAGALGCGLSGSGPAMYALSADGNTAATVLEAMLDAALREGIPAKGIATGVDFRGVRTVEEAS